MRNQAPARRNTRQAVMQATGEKIAQFQHQVDEFAGHLQQALPRHVPLDRFKRVLITAASMNPDLLLADRRTLFLSAIKCASDGLMPDGRHAALVVYNTEVKRRDPETGLDHKFRIDAVQYLPMVAGIRERMRNTGEVASADAQCVYAGDEFDYSLGDTPYIHHKPAPLTEDRGEIRGAYAIIRLKNGEVLRDVMRKSEIEQTRSVSRAKDGPMWTKFYGEACRKTVLRRCSKAAPQTADLDRLIGSDEDETPPISLPPLTELPAPEPQRVADTETIEPDFEVVDTDGAVFPFHEAKTAAEALRRVYDAAAKRGPVFLDGALETNATLQLQLEKQGEWFEIPDAAPAEGRRAPEIKPARTVAATGDKAASGPPAADTEPPFPGDLPSRTDRQSAEIPVPLLASGKPDYRRWALGLFLPRVRQTNSSADLALLMGDNERNLDQAKRALSPADLADFEAEIDARWAEVDEIERQTA